MSLDKAIRTRAGIKGTATRFKNFLDDFGPSGSIHNLQTRLTDYKKLLDKFNDIQEQIEILEKKADQDVTIREEFEESYYENIAIAEEIIAERTKPRNDNRENVNHGASGSGSQRDTNIGSDIAVQLPIINLPSFSGSYSEWTAFYDSFQSLIHENSKLSEIQKLHYLRSCLNEDAKRTIESLPVSADSYQEAWRLLKDRYQNKRLIVQNHIHDLFNLPSMSKAPSSLRELFDKLNSTLAALKAQNIDTATWDAMLIYIVTSKFDFPTKREWEAKLTSNEIPKFSDLKDFLTKRCLTLESLEFKNPTHSSGFDSNKQKSRPQEPVNKRYNQIVANVNEICFICKQNRHPLHQCSEFIKLNVNDRIEQVKKHKLCFNCLKGGHDANTCRAGSCKTCSNKHNSLLHYEKRVNNQNLNISSNNNCRLESTIQIMLLTVVIQCYDVDGNLHTSRALLDQGSQQHLITDSLRQKLKLNVNPVHAGISGVCGAYNEINQACELEFKSMINNYTAKINCLIVPQVNKNFPLETFDKSEIPIPGNITLADSEYNISAPIEILIGAGLFWELLENGRIRLTNGQTYIQNTRLGWIIGGPFTTAAIQINNSFCFNIRNIPTTTNHELERQMFKFWEIEEYTDNKKSLTSEEQFCENLFNATHKRDKTGKFIVHLPFKTETPDIGLTYQIALKRFLLLEKRFKANPELQTEYCKFMDDYLNLNHMQLANDGSYQEGCFLPHHGVIKEGSLTTKIRAVFDASCKSSNGTSLNDHLLPGPNLQRDIFSLLIKFRQHKYVLSADIIKMFRQIWVTADHWEFQKILWRPSADKEIKVYHLKTVSYGTACAPYLAMKCLQQLATEAAEKYPKASKVIRENFYMDDLLTGTNTLEEAKVLRDEVTEILNSGGFQLAKWASNDVDLLPLSDTNKNNLIIRLDANMHTKTLGLSWDCAHDTLKYEITNRTTLNNFTKRTVLSTIATIYDPIGLLGPILVIAKLILQTLWQRNCSWDEKLPLDLYNKFEQFLVELPHINKFQIPRKVIPVYPYKAVQLHGFSDASTRAYGAAVYIRTTDMANQHSVFLLCSKTRVAPLKQITLPRLELCAALILAQLVSKIKKSLDLRFDNCYLWCDSTITLSWIVSSPNRWQTFISNRVSKIQDVTTKSEWRHIASANNPADIASRGMSPVDLQSCKLWWQGPSFLAKNQNEWPESTFTFNENAPEQRKVTIVNTAFTENFSLFSKFSNFYKLKRIVAYCLRFFNNCRTKNDTKTVGNLSITELRTAERCIVKAIQSRHFFEEIKNLRENREIHNKSNLKALNVFLDKDQILRVGGRLSNADIAFNHKHPILLPKHDNITKLIIQYIHEKELHAGTQATLAAVRRTYWPVAGRSAVRQIIHKCIKCYKIRPISCEEIMGDLPTDRVTPARPFLNCGVDYAGPISVKICKGRGNKTMKAYVAIFVCLATKDPH